MPTGGFTACEAMLTMRPNFRGHHAVDGRLHHLDVAQHHGVERVDPILARPGAEVAGQPAVGIVDEDVGRGARGEHRGAAFRGRDIGGDRGDTDAARRGDLLRGGRERRAAPRHDGQCHAFARERRGAGAAEPAARTADDSRSAADAEIHGLGHVWMR